MTTATVQGAASVTALSIAPHGRSHGSRAVARNLVVRPPGRDMTNATPSRPKIASGKTLDLQRAQTHTPRGRAASRFCRNAGGLRLTTPRRSSPTWCPSSRFRPGCLPKASVYEDLRQHRGRHRQGSVVSPVVALVGSGSSQLPSSVVQWPSRSGRWWPDKSIHPCGRRKGSQRRGRWRRAVRAAVHPARLRQRRRGAGDDAQIALCETDACPRSPSKWPLADSGLVPPAHRVKSARPSESRWPATAARRTPGRPLMWWSQNNKLRLVKRPIGQR
jgi:hypothetical protein